MKIIKWISLNDEKPKIGETVIYYTSHGQIEQLNVCDRHFWKYPDAKRGAWYTHFSRETLSYLNIFAGKTTHWNENCDASLIEKGKEISLLIRKSDGVHAIVQAVAGKMYNGFGLPNCAGWECAVMDKRNLVAWSDVAYQRPQSGSKSND